MLELAGLFVLGLEHSPRELCTLGARKSSADFLCVASARSCFGAMVQSIFVMDGCPDVGKATRCK